VVFGDFHLFGVWSVRKENSKRLNGFAENCKLSRVCETGPSQSRNTPIFYLRSGAKA
jgi:hypothetical protein